MKKLISIIMVVVMAFTMSGVALACNDTVTTSPYDNSEFYTVGDYTLHYRVFEGEEVKNQILLIHGFCLSTASLEKVAKLYAQEGYRVVLADCPNFGYSSRENTSTALMDREEVIYSLMEYLGGTWIVGGHSMGGGIAINLACDYENTVTGLVLFAPQTSAEPDEKMAAFSKSFLMQGVYTVILNVMARIPFVVKMLVAMSFSDSEYAKAYDVSKISEPLLLKGTGAGITIMSSHAKGPDFDKLKVLDIPCVIVTAKEDKVASGDNLQAIIDNAPANTVLCEFEKGGHMMMEYDPQLTFEKTIATIEACK